MGCDVVRWTSARARGPVSVVALGRPDLDALSRNAPPLANKVLRKLAEVTANPRDLSSMKQVTIGGAACPPALMEAYDKLGVRLCQAWGMTETSPLGTMAHPPAGLTD